MSVLASTVGPSAYWYLTRASGTVALVLPTAALLLGMLNVTRVSARRWPRFVIDGIHRRVSMLAVAFLVIHILTSVLDSFAPIGLLDAVIPFHGAYRPFWLGLGALAFDLLFAVLITSLVRARLGHGTWRAIHWLAYACWPVAVLHGLGTGSDAKQWWLMLVVVTCVSAVLVAAVVHLTVMGSRFTSGMRAAGLVGVVGFALGLSVWVPQGPLGRNWARRSGTPRSLLTKPVAPRRNG
ncbi:MAG: ferric reductase-like transmembrane domain-containing protein [Solirubrobacteraceae bacterium]